MSTTPSPTRLRTTLRVLFSLQAREVEQRILHGVLDAPDLTPWIERMVKMVTPFLQEYYEHGMKRTAVQLGIDAMSDVPGGHGNRLNPDHDGTRRIPLKSFPLGKGPIPRFSSGGMISVEPRGIGIDSRGSLGNPNRPAPLSAMTIAKAVKRSVDAVLHRNRTTAGFNPKVIDAVNQAALHFCRETLETATTDVDTALEAVRTDLQRHLRYSTRYGPESERGETQHILRSLATSVGRIFNDPYRALRIANTEYSRAVNAGAVIEAKAAPFATIKIWESARGSCKLCKALNGKKRKLDQPFVVLDEPGPYSRVLHPPLHPSCNCEMDIRRSA